MLASTPVRVAFALALASARGAAQDTLRMSVDANGAEGNYSSEDAAVSADGSLVAFTSYADNLVPGDTNNTTDVFLRDRVAGTIERVSVDSSGAEGNSASWGVMDRSISGDGRFIVFSSGATNLCASDTNGVDDVFVRDRTLGTTERVSVDSNGAEGNGVSYLASISQDGRCVAFLSWATNFAATDTNGQPDVFVRDLATGATECISVNTKGTTGNSYSGKPAMSGDGNLVAFGSDASDLIASDHNGFQDVFLRDRSAGTTERVSVDTAGGAPNYVSYWPSLSDDGGLVAFASGASDLVSGDTNHHNDVFVRDLANQTTTRVSVDSAGGEANDDCEYPVLSAGGRFVAFSSHATNLVTGDANKCSDGFAHDRAAAATERISVDSTGGEADGDCGFGGISVSADGRVFAFWSYAGNLVSNDNNNATDVFVHEHCSVPASWTNYGAGFRGTHGVPSLSANALPQFGATITVSAGNSLGSPTVGLLFLGLQRAQIHSPLGGDLLVLPSFTLPITFSFGGDSFTGDLPGEMSLCGTTVDLQVVETDPGAAHGVSFSEGLELVLGY